MSDYTILIEPRDPMIVRDGRPFAADPGARAISLDWPMPSTLAGAIRAQYWNANCADINIESERVKNISVQGPFMVCRGTDNKWEIYISAPADAIPYEKDNSHHVMALSPFKPEEGAGCNIPDNMLPLYIDDEFKAIQKYAYWSLDDSIKWMCGKFNNLPLKFSPKLKRESRVHVSVDSQTGTSLEGKLFSTESICFNDVVLNNKKCDGDEDSKQQLRMAMVAKIDSAEEIKQNAGFMHFGGEKRLSVFSGINNIWPEYPDIYAGCQPSNRLKLMAITPCIFSNGWKPRWLETGMIPGIDDIKVKLVSAVITGKKPVSGWDLITKKPKAVRYAVPAGCIYFLEVTEGELNDDVMRKLWFRSICDEKQDNLDGFGLTIPGIWNYPSKEDK